MTEVYKVLDKLRDTLRDDPNVDTVSYGDISKIDLDKTTMFPLAHLDIRSVTVAESVIRFTISLFCLDIVDTNKSVEPDDVFYGNNNLQDVHNTQLTVVNRLIELMRRGSLFTDMFQIEGEVDADMITDDYGNLLAGWAVEFTVNMPNNNISVCT